MSSGATGPTSRHGRASGTHSRSRAALLPAPRCRRWRAAEGTVWLDPALVQVDAVDFERAAGKDDVADLDRAAELYRADLLDGIGVTTLRFDEWLRDERERFREVAVQVL